MHAPRKINKMVDIFMKIAILTPTRARPHRMKIFNDSVRETATENENVSIYYYIDSDDPKLEEYKVIDILHRDKAYFHVGVPQSISISWNVIAKQAIEAGADILIMGNDDLIYQTKNWDKLLEEEIKKFPDNIYCMWFNDLLAQGKWCAFPIISKEWYNCLGYFTPGVFHFGYNDTWVWDIGKKLDRCHYISHIVAKHEHISRNRHLMDDTYQRVRQGKQGNLFHKDGKIFTNSEHTRIEHAEKLRKLMK